MKIWPYMCVSLLGAALSAAFPKEKQLFGWLTAGAAGVLLLLGLLGEGGALGKGLEDFSANGAFPPTLGKRFCAWGLRRWERIWGRRPVGTQAAGDWP